MMFSKSYCPFCEKIKDLFERNNLRDYKVVELDEIRDGDKMQQALHQLSGQRTVPNIYINKKHVGGADDTVKAQKDGSLA